MNGKPILVDYFCGAGGATRGYQLAGWLVVGIDDKPQPNYCGDEFIQADAISHMENWLPLISNISAVHASPPCQHFTAYRRRHSHVRPAPNLIAPVREHLAATGKPYVIENVSYAKHELREPITLCGSMFGLDVQRHRCFESNVRLDAPLCRHDLQAPRFPPATNRTNLRKTVEVGVYRIPLDVQRRAMGIDWMTLPELSQAIPPAYTQHIGERLLAVL